ncbi:MAG: hypothetical protein ACRERU_15335 [Methylococcales bacterium]
MILSLTLAACGNITTITPDGQETTRSREEFESYVESVFRRQNQASVEAGQLVNEEIRPRNRGELEAAERNMLRACSALNQVVKLKMEQQDPGIFLELEVRDTIGDCDFATRILEQLIALQE